jgi:hypothetical protein
MTRSSSPVITDGDGLATVVIFALRSPPGSRTLEFSCRNSFGQAISHMKMIIAHRVANVRPLSPSPSSTPQVIGAPFSTQPSFQLCQSSQLSRLLSAASVDGTCIPLPGQVVVAVAESFTSDTSLDGNKMARLGGFVSSKSNALGIVTFSNLTVLGSSSQRVYFSFYAGGNVWSTWDGSQCFPGSGLRCTSYVQLSGGPSIKSIRFITNFSSPLIIEEGASFPSITIQATSASNYPIQNMVMYAQFSRIAGAASPKYTTPLKFGKKLLKAVAVTNHLGQAQFNLRSSISGFAGAYDVIFLPSITSSVPRNLIFPVISVRIATTVASVFASGPDCVVRTFVRSAKSTAQGAPVFGLPAPCTFDEMKTTDFSTFFRMYFGEESGTNNQIAQYRVFATDAEFNDVPEKLVELHADPPDALDLFADTDCQGPFSGRSLRPNLLPVTLADTGSVDLCLKIANPMPLSSWPRPPDVLHGINTARFHFVIDGVRSPFFVTVFLSPPMPPAPATPRILLDNFAAFSKVFGSQYLYQEQLLMTFCNTTLLGSTDRSSGYYTDYGTSLLCDPSNTYSVSHTDSVALVICVFSCLSLPQILQVVFSDIVTIPWFFFVLPPPPVEPLSRVVGKSAVGAESFSIRYGFTNFNGLPQPSYAMCLVGRVMRTSFFANSQAFKALSSGSAMSLTTLTNNAYQTAASYVSFSPNSTALLQCNEDYMESLRNRLKPDSKHEKAAATYTQSM